MTKQKQRASRKDRSYLVAAFANFPGVEIPLLSDEGEHRGSTDDTSCVVAPYERRYTDVPAGAQRSRTAQRQDQARGIERGHFPPFETWSPEQQKAGRELGMLLYQMAAGQALSVLTSATDAMKCSDYEDIVAFERDAARRAVGMLANGIWKPERGQTYTYGLEDWMQHFLRGIASGEFSLVRPDDPAVEDA